MTWSELNEEDCAFVVCLVVLRTTFLLSSVYLALPSTSSSVISSYRMVPNYKNETQVSAIRANCVSIWLIQRIPHFFLPPSFVIVVVFKLLMGCCRYGNSSAHTIRSPFVLTESWSEMTAILSIYIYNGKHKVSTLKSPHIFLLPLFTIPFGREKKKIKTKRIICASSASYIFIS